MPPFTKTLKMAAPPSQVERSLVMISRGSIATCVVASTFFKEVVGEEISVNPFHRKNRLKSSNTFCMVANLLWALRR